jgi:hypothetical protein
MATTLGKLASELGIDTAHAMDLCRRIGVIAWSEHTPLDDDEAARVRAALAGGEPAAAPTAPGGADVFSVPPGWSTPPPPPGSGPAPPVPGAGLPPPPPSAAPGYLGGYVGARRTEGLAIAALVLGLLGWIPCGIGSLVAIVLGIRAVKRIDANKATLDGRGMAVAGIVLGFVGLAFVGLIAVVAVLGEDVDDEGAGSSQDDGDGIVDINSKDAFELEIGDCFDQPELGTQQRSGSLDRTSCGDPHDAEVFARLEHPAGDDEPYPGNLAMTTFAQQECLGSFEGYIGSSYQTSQLDISYLFPQDVLWSAVDERTVICGAFNVDGSPLVGSVRRSGR